MQPLPLVGAGEPGQDESSPGKCPGFAESAASSQAVSSPSPASSSSAGAGILSPSASTPKRLYSQTITAHLDHPFTAAEQKTPFVERLWSAAGHQVEGRERLSVEHLFQELYVRMTFP